MTKKQKRVRNIVIHTVVFGSMILFNNCSGFTAADIKQATSQASQGVPGGALPLPSGTPAVGLPGATPGPVVPTPIPTPTPTPPPSNTVSFVVTGGSASPTSVSANQTVTLTATYQAGASASGINIDLEVRDQSNGQIMGNPQKVFGGESFSSQQSKTYSWSYVVPSLPAGTYCFVAAAFDSAWAKTYTWNSCVASFTVSASAPAPTPVPGPTAVPAPVGTPVPTSNAFLTGVNLAGADTNAGKAGARLWTDYAYPNNNEIDYFASKGLKVIRIPFDANRVQPQRNGSLSSTELSYLDPVVNYVTSKGMKALLDPHNYGYLNDSSGTGRLIGVDSQMPASMLADFWGKLAQHYISNPDVIFGLMNEPNAQTAAQWKAVAVASVNAIRATGSSQMIFIPGTGWTGGGSWGVGSVNATAWSGFSDINFAYEIHQYLDSDSSGTHPDCISGAGSSRLSSVTDWLRSQHAKGFLGEVGWANNSLCMSEGNAIIKHMSDNRDAWSGYTYWAAGPWWGEYMYTVEPTGLGTGTVTDRAQLSILMQYK